jgi:hypothetical protein
MVEIENSILTSIKRNIKDRAMPIRSSRQRGMCGADAVTPVASVYRPR